MQRILEQRWYLDQGEVRLPVECLPRAGLALAMVTKCLIFTAMKSMHTKRWELKHRLQIRFSSKNHQQPKLVFSF